MADFDQWRISEIFSNGDGSVQFIELQTTASNQTNLAGRVLVATDGVSQQQDSVQFSANLIGETANASLLLATTAFEQLTGLTADVVIAEGFVPTRSGTLDFAAGTNSVSYGAGQLPRNGTQSLDASLGIQTYGFLPMDLPPGYRFLSAVHGVDEGIPVDALCFGADAIFQVLRSAGRG